MKRFILPIISLFAALLISEKAQAQFLENSFASVGIGVNATILHPRSPKTWGNAGFAGNIQVGKWWNPYIGTRLGFHGFRNQCAQELDTQAIPAGQSFNFHYIHADFLYCLTSSIMGPDKTDRIWDLSLQVNTGALKVAKAYSWGIGAGILNEFRVSPTIGLTVDLQAIATKPSAFTSSGGRLAIFPAATVGVSFNLGEIF